MNQTNAIVRYFGSQGGLYGGTPMETYYADWALDTFEDLWNAGPQKAFFKPDVDDETKKTLGEKFEHFCDQLEKRLNCKDAKPFLGGQKMSIGDIKCYSIFSMQVFNDNVQNKVMSEHFRTITATFPAVKAWVGVMDGHFAAYYAKHPKPMV